VTAAPDSVEVAEAAAAYRSLYVHLPFCRRRCPYCDFAVVALDEGAPDVSAYTRALLRELAMVEPWEALDAVNLGGGTPSATSSAELALLLDAVEARFELTPGAEISLEVNPEDVTPASAAASVELGFTRISLGVQSFDDEVLRALGRVHSAAQAADAIRTLRGAGFASVNIDLIFGTPVETTVSWDRTLDVAMELEPDHLSAYALTVERGTELSRQIADGAPAPDPDTQADRYEMLCARAGDAGLVRYEVSNFARPGHTCRYNLGTWAGGEYEAVGLGAHGHRDGVRYRNVRRLDVYRTRVDEGERPRAGADRGDPDDVERERLMLGLRRVAGVATGRADHALRTDATITRLVDAGVVVIDDARMRVREPLLTDEVTRAVLALQL
jgi:putative oxygen-independent coproporphyrinogen III oxidase